MNSKIKVGLLIDDFEVAAWVYKMLEVINESEYGDIVLVVKKKPVDNVAKPYFVGLKEKLRLYLYEKQRKFEVASYKLLQNPFEKKNCKALVNEAKVLEVKCVEKKYSDYLTEEDIVKIREFKIDVFIRLGFRILRGDILNIARLGVWSYHHGDNFLFRGGPPIFWEFFKKKNEVGSILQILTEDLDGGEVLYRSWSSVQISFNQTAQNFYWKTLFFIPRKLNELHRLGEEKFKEKMRAENSDLYFYSSKNYSAPLNYQFLKLFIPYCINWIKYRIWIRFNFEQWILLYSFNKKNALSTSIFRYKRIIPPKDWFWADPFVVYKNDKYYIFFEELIYKKIEELGHLSVFEISDKGVMSEPRIILQKPYHLSYPFILEYGGEYYLIPESEATCTIQLYKAKKFPYEWEFQMNLMENVKAVDTTILFKDNKFWLFTNIQQVPGSAYHDELFLFSSDTLFTNNWKSHPANPIVSDVKTARPAGKMFYYNNKLYRPSQDCSKRYGYATIINEIILMNEKEYKERKVSDIRPEWADDVVATHTLSSENGLTVIDAMIKRKKRWF